MLVDPDATTRPHFEARSDGQLVFRAHAHAQDDQLGRESLARLQADAEAIKGLLERLGGLAEQQGHALGARCSATGVVISLSKGGSTWSCNSTTVVVTPRRTRFSTSSRPMNPAPTTTACRTPWSSFAWMRSMSCKFRSVKTPGRSMPGSGGRIGAAPGARISVS